MIHSRQWKNAIGFTLLELLAAMTITIMLVLALVSTFNIASNTWLKSENQTETAYGGRLSLEYMARRLAEAEISPSYTFLGTSNNVAFVTTSGSASICDNENWFTGVNYSSNHTVRAASSQSFSWWCPAGIYWWKAHDMFQTTATWPDAGPSVYPGGYTVLSRDVNWPATTQRMNQWGGGNGCLAYNVWSLRFQYFTNSPSSAAAVYTDFWNSDTNQSSQNDIANCFGDGSSLPGWGNNWVMTYNGTSWTSNQTSCSFMTNRLPAGVLITISLLDSRNVALLSAAGTSATVSNTVLNRALRTYSVFTYLPASQQ